MDTKSFGCLAPNPWTPRLLIVGSKSMDTKTFDHLAWGHPPFVVAISNLANVSSTHLGNQTCHKAIFYPGTLQDHDKAEHILLLLSTHTL
jgi:hypothetical protein